MFLSFFSLCSVPSAGIGRSSGAGTDMAVGGRGHFGIGRLARVEKSVEKSLEIWRAVLGLNNPYDVINGIVSIFEICKDGIAKNSAWQN